MNNISPSIHPLNGRDVFSRGHRPLRGPAFANPDRAKGREINLKKTDDLCLLNIFN